MEEKKFKRHPCQQATYLSLSFIHQPCFSLSSFPTPQILPKLGQETPVLSS